MTGDGSNLLDCVSGLGQQCDCRSAKVVEVQETPALSVADFHRDAKYRFLKGLPVVVVRMIGEVRGSLSSILQSAEVHRMDTGGPGGMLCLAAT